MNDIKNIVKKIEVYCGVEFECEIVKKIKEADSTERLELLIALMGVVTIENQEMPDDIKLQIIQELIIYSLA